MCLRTINNFPNYAITDDGRVWSNKRERFLKPYSNTFGYKQIELWRNKHRFQKIVHRLVLETFVGKCPDGMETCHNNGVRDDNRLENLRWDTKTNNVIDSIKHGTFLKSKLTQDDVRTIRYMHSKEGYSQRQIAEIYKVSYGTVNFIVNRKTWKFVL